jgi:hypothetical protein
MQLSWFYLVIDENSPYFGEGENWSTPYYWYWKTKGGLTHSPTMVIGIQIKITSSAIKLKGTSFSIYKMNEH